LEGNDKVGAKAKVKVEGNLNVIPPMADAMTQWGPDAVSRKLYFIFIRDQLTESKEHKEVDSNDSDEWDSLLERWTGKSQIAQNSSDKQAVEPERQPEALMKRTWDLQEGRGQKPRPVVPKVCFARNLFSLETRDLSGIDGGKKAIF